LKDLLAYQMPVPSAASLIFAAAILRVDAWRGRGGLVGESGGSGELAERLAEADGHTFGLNSFST
jgi:hypothetical protein